MDRILNIKNHTGLNEYHLEEIDGMVCHFCHSKSRSDTIIIVYQKTSRIDKMIEKEEKWKHFQNALYYADIRTGESVGVVSIIYVLDNDASNIPIQMIESNRTYGRKYVFTEEEAITFLNGIVKSGSEDIDRVSPVQEWDRILGEIDLTGCLTESYLKRKIITYLEGSKFNADYSSDVDFNEPTSSEIPLLKWVRSLDTTGFRDFCFDGIEMEFGQINLFYGANGSGKTSVLEAIEYALTSEVRRVKDFKIKIKADNLPKVTIYDKAAGVHSFNPSFSKKYSKEIEKIWYGVPKGRTKTSLNENFNRFNSFDSEAAYKFIHETNNDEASYSSLFGNLIFGESVVNYEKNWIRYKAAFDEIYSEIRENLSNARYWKPVYESSIAEKLKSASLKNDIEIQLNKFGYINTSDSSHVEYIRSNRLYKDLLLVKKYVEVLALPNLESKSLNKLEIELQSIFALNSKQEQEMKNFENELVMIAESDADCQRKISDVIKESKEAENDMEHLGKTQNDWSDVQRILENTETISMVNTLANESEEIDREIQYILTIEQNICLMNFLNSQSYNRLLPDEQSRIKSKVDELKIKRITAEKEYREVKKSFDSNEQKAMDLREIAKSLLIDASCPLCGYSYPNKAILIENIESVASIDDHIEQMQRYIHELNVEINNNENILERETLINKAINELESLKSKVPFIAEHPNDYIELFNYVNNKSELHKRKNEIIEKQMVLSSQGFSMQNINSCLLFKSTDAAYLDYLNVNIGTFVDYLEAKIIRVQAKIENTSSNIKVLENTIENNQQRIQVIKSEVNRLEVQKSALRINENKEIEQAIGVIKKHFVIDESVVLREWINGFNLLFDKCEVNAKHTVYEDSLEFDREQLSSYETTIKKLTPQVERCAKAIQAFERMSSLSSYVEHSIKRNMQQISKYFRWMHHSGEFTELGVDNDGLYSIRGIDDEVVRIYQMSTGQRTSIAMAVMLALHMAAPDAPNFLLLDEPLANMDDTQVLNVLDIFKSIAEQNTQIFFTTANGEMIRHFKECFRDSKFDYKEYRFVKRVNRPSEIIECSINDTPSIEDLTLDDLTLDFTQFAMIRDVLRKNQEKLLTDEDWEEGTVRENEKQKINLENNTSSEFFSLLNNDEQTVINILLIKNCPDKEIVNRLSVYPLYRTIIENINDKAIDYFGETIIDNDDTPPKLDESYFKILLEMHEKKRIRD